MDLGPALGCQHWLDAGDWRNDAWRWTAQRDDKLRFRAEM